MQEEKEEGAAVKIAYDVSKEKGSNRWYAHKVGFSYIPCIIDGRPTFGTKKEALHNAALMMGLTYKDYMQLRRKV